MSTRAQYRVGVVTGANRGLGHAISRLLAQRGHHVVLTGRDDQLVTTAAKVLTDEGLPVSGMRMDVTDETSVSEAIDTIVSAHGRIDALVNNAAVVGDRGQKASAPDFARIATILDTNLIGAWRCAAAVAQPMIDAGYGRIVNISSHLASLSTMGNLGGVSYRVSKTALNALTRVLAAELDGTGVLVNSCSPGRVNTRLALPGHDVREPDEAADTPVWLATLPDGGPTGGFWADRAPLPW